MLRNVILTCAFALGVVSFAAPALAGALATDDNPDAIVNLATSDGAQIVGGTWRYHDVRLVDVEHRLPGADTKPSGEAVRTNNIEPQAGAKDFDDSGWKIVDPTDLESRRTTGRFAFGWYRLNVTIPPRVGAFETTGATVVLSLTLDDYAEIWVDGKLPQVLGQVGGNLVAGWNAPNRLVIRRDAQPGQSIQIAIFAANGPLSAPPGNYIWIRSATLDFYKPGRWNAPTAVKLDVDRRDAGLDSILPADAKLERVATGFTFTEGPVWTPAQVAGAGATPIDRGYLLFSDPNRNAIYRWSEDDGVSIYRTKSGYAGVDIAEYRQPGSNGLTLDAAGRLTICEHGNRRITRLEKNGALTVLADRLDGKRLNSPNDLVYRSDGALFFTDPVFGLPKFADDPRRQSPHTGVYCLVDGKLKLATNDLSGPNGIAFSPDERFIYVGNWDEKRKVLMRYAVAPDGGFSDGIVFFDMTPAVGEDALDGVKVDERGNVYVSGPGGLWVLSADAKHLGTLRGPEHPHNLAWGDTDGKTLYWAAQSSIYRLRLNIPGIRPNPGAAAAKSPVSVNAQ